MPPETTLIRKAKRAIHDHVCMLRKRYHVLFQTSESQLNITRDMVDRVEYEKSHKSQLSEPLLQECSEQQYKRSNASDAF